MTSATRPATAQQILARFEGKRIAARCSPKARTRIYGRCVESAGQPWLQTAGKRRLLCALATKADDGSVIVHEPFIKPTTRSGY
jgi:hypothetical protein